MKKLKSQNIFLSLVSVMILIKLSDLIFQPNKIFPGRIAAFSWIEILIVLLLGFAGLFFYQKIKFPDFDNKKIRTKKAILISIGLGLFFGLLFMAYDSIAKIGDISVGWPLSILFYIFGAITSETIYRLFASSFFVWLFGNLLFKEKYNKQIFWIVAVLISLIGAMGMMMAFSNPEIPLTKPNNFLFFALGTLVFASELTSFKLFKEYGFLSSLIFRISFYSVWHILWPNLFY